MIAQTLAQRIRNHVAPSRAEMAAYADEVEALGVGPLAALTDAAMRGVLDPGSFVKRGVDNDGNAYGESLYDWQRRALDVSLRAALDADA